MRHGRTLRRAIAAIALLLAAGTGGAQEAYPNRPLRFIVPFPPGGGPSIVARLIGDKLRDRFGQPVIVENRPGAGANIGAEAVFRAPPDGYTLLVTPPGPLVINKSLYPKLAYDPDQFVPVSVLAMSPTLLIANSNQGIHSVEQLIAAAKAAPGRLNYASPGSGTTGHLASEMFNVMAGVKILHIPYKGLGPALTDLIGGQVGAMFMEIGGALPHVRAGKVTVLAIGSPKRSPILPDVPALTEVLPGLVILPWFGMVAPPQTPPAIIARLASATAEAMRQPDVIERLQQLSLDPVGGTPDEMSAFMRREREFWARLVRMTGASVE